ncbi:gastric mucin-like protein [Purpureocillium lavendulum]|uniref:Gastric mucin-like protein n=1 Tax=Purpureocillium lavendulum TaxID=1247861 RepID=A0AB34FS56_9HYPO|nr:gastric mucin-like protein [Purpureocillium lavendulum]
MIPKTSGPLGSVVAFEGRPDTISTQLRLLPTSPQVLILPSVQCYLPSETPGQLFDSRVYVRQVHDALVARNDAARAFLQGSTPSNKRLVFMNGGTPSAQALCVRAIMTHETSGNRAEAGAIFDDLVKDGLAGLEQDRNAGRKRNTFGYSQYGSDRDDFEDPITRAMRAADALDRQTANLQPSEGLDLSSFTRQRSSSLPMYGYSDEFGDAAPFFVFGARRESQVDDAAMVPATPKTPSCLATTQREDSAQRLSRLMRLHASTYPYSPSCAGETYQQRPLQDRPEADAPSPVSDVFSIRTQDHVIYGEASLLDVRSSICRGPVTRVKSLDRLYPASPKFRDLGIPSESWLAEAESETPRASRPQSLMLIASDRDGTVSRLSTIEQPRTVIVKSKLPVVRMAPVPESKKRTKKPGRAGSTYIDRGTDAVTGPQLSPFQPVFTCTEDLVVYLKDGAPDGILEAAINAFKDGRYPLVSPSPTVPDYDHTGRLVPGTPDSQPRQDKETYVKLPKPSSGARPTAPVTTGGEDYDPFAYMQPTWQPRRLSNVAPKVTIVRPPTPVQTPPPTVTIVEREQKFHEFTVAANQTAVAVQNSLRSMLGEYFPPETEGYHQFQFSLLPELDGLWKPIFRTVDPEAVQLGDGRVHQILAIGSQQGVKKEYSSAITGRLEKLGSKSSELGRADRLDFRYLLANAMQAFTAQPLANQTSDNPFTNPYLLATLIVPHLETYLALHSEVRYLLLQYPAEHFKTVLALQKLVGVELMKVAQIVDSNSKEHLPFTHIRGASIGTKTESSAAKRSSPSPRSSFDTPVSKANYLLTSTASDKDIAIFVSTVWNISAETSDSDTPEPPPEKMSKRKAKPAPLRLKDNLSPFPKVSPQSPVSPRLTSPRTVTILQPPPASAASTLRPPSASGTVKTFRSGRSRQSRRGNGNYTPSHVETASILTYDPNDDSDYDVEERRLMPLFMRKSPGLKPSSRKALKFLGLA